MTLVEANYGMTAYVPITGQYVPDAGYLVLYEVFFDANVIYTPYTIGTI